MLRNRVAVQAQATAPLAPKSPADSMRLLAFDEVPEWYADNPFITAGYRPVALAAAPCLRSMLHIHNQTANIFTHLIPGAVALVLNVALHDLFTRWYPDASFADRAVFHVYLTTCTLCFGVSAAYHTLLCHSQDWADRWIQRDYVGISVLILGSFMPGLYLGFYCEPGLMKGYMGMILTMGSVNIYKSLNDRHGDKDWFTARVLPFLGLGFSAFVPIMHAALIFPYDQLQKQAGLNYYYLEGVFMLVGVAFMATKFPECWMPGKFDYWGASHQVFHCFVVLGAVSHFVGILSGFDWNYNNQRCAIR